MGLPLGRTHPDEAKNRGLSYCRPMKQDGVEIRPIRRPAAAFSEDFSTVRARRRQNVGEPGGPWRVCERDARVRARRLEARPELMFQNELA